MKNITSNLHFTVLPLEMENTGENLVAASLYVGQIPASVLLSLENQWGGRGITDGRLAHHFAHCICHGLCARKCLLEIKNQSLVSVEPM